jgi:DNA-binding transcriptional regulator YhcF (GntR family)
VMATVPTPGPASRPRGGIESRPDQCTDIEMTESLTPTCGLSPMTEPMYRRIAEDLHARIDSGELRLGHQLETEIERERYGVSRDTIRDAIKLLTTLGLVETRPGQGTFVVRKMDPYLTQDQVARALEWSPSKLTRLEGKEARVPWRPVGAVVSAGVPSAVGMVHPFIGVGMAVVELAAALTVIGTVLFGSPELSERAFRLLRWIANRPEPPAPSERPGNRGICPKPQPGNAIPRRGLSRS